MRDLDGDERLDIVLRGNVLAWLNDGSGHYVTLKTTLYPNDDGTDRSLFDFAAGAIVRDGARFRWLQFHSPDEDAGQRIAANAGWMLTNPVITLAQ